MMEIFNSLSQKQKVHAGEKSANVISQIEEGLAHAPTSAEGWASYAEALAPVNANKAAQALDQAFTLAPYDIFWAGRRVQLAARIWNYLGGDAKDEAIRQTHMLWDEPTFRNEIFVLSTTSTGIKLLTRAYAKDPDTLRAINRWISAQQRRLQSQKP